MNKRAKWQGSELIALVFRILQMKKDYQGSIVDMDRGGNNEGGIADFRDCLAKIELTLTGAQALLSGLKEIIV